MSRRIGLLVCQCEWLLVLLASSPELEQGRETMRQWPAWLRNDVLQGVLVALFAITYGATLLPGIHDFGDVTKAQFVGRLLGTTHPTGYPLYLLVTWAFSWVPVGSLAFRGNALSALFALATLVLVYRTQRNLGVRNWVALLGTCAFGWSGTFWSQSVIAEVYALNSCLVGGVLFCLVRWRISADRRWFIAGCSLYAISFGNHLTVVTLLPAVAYAAFAGDRSVLTDRRAMAAIAAAILLGMALYAYPWWRTKAGSMYLEYHVRNFSELADYVTGERYRKKMFMFTGEDMLFSRLPKFAGQLVAELGPGAVLAPAGALFIADRWLRNTLCLALLGELVWVIGYDIPDIHIYIIPVALVAAILAGRGLEAIAAASTGGRQTATCAVVAAACVLPLPYLNASRMNHEKAASFSESIDRELDHLGTGAVVVGRVEYSQRMAYVYHLYAQGMAKERNLHLSDNANPRAVEAYLSGSGTLKDSHTRELLPAGLRVFIARRAAKEGWSKLKTVDVGPQQHGFRELTLP